MNTTLRDLRQQRGFATQAQLGEACGVTQSAISLIERGKVSGRVQTLKLIAKALGMSLDELVDATTTPVEPASLDI